MKRLAIIAVIFWVLYAPLSCDPDCDRCYDYRVDSLDLKVGEFHEQRLFERDFTPPISDTVAWREFSIRLEILEFSSYHVTFLQSPIATANAEPVAPFTIVDSISVTSDKAVIVNGITYPAGSVLNKFINVPNYYGSSFKLTDFNGSRWDMDRSVFLTFGGTLDQVVDQKFKVSVAFGYRTFELETRNVVVKP